MSNTPLLHKVKPFLASELMATQEVVISRYTRVGAHNPHFKPTCLILLFVCSFVSLFVCVPVFLSACVVCLFVCLFACLLVCLIACWYVSF